MSRLTFIERIKRLRIEQDRTVSAEEMEMLTAKYRLWKVLMGSDAINCVHCIFNKGECDYANKHFSGPCLAFLREGNYV